MVGFIIGRGGERVKSIAKDAGAGCRIIHQREQHGTFVISAYTKKAILFAEVKIKQAIVSAKKNKPITVKKPQPQQNKPFNHNQFDMLVENTVTLNNPKPSYNKPMDLQFTQKGSIRERRHQNWLRKTKQTPYQTQPHKPADQPETFQQNETHFPTLGNPNTSIKKTTWGSGNLDTVKTAPKEPPKKVVTPEEPKETEFNIKFNPHSTFTTDLDYQKSSWDDDCSEWSEEEYEDHNFQDEVDDWQNETRTHVAWA